MRKAFIILFHVLFIYSYGLGQEYLLKNYNVSDGLKGTIVYSYFQDSLGFIWMGSNNCLSRFDGQAFTNYTEPEELFKDYIWDIDQSEKGNLLLVTYSGKVWEFDGNDFGKYSFNHEILDTAHITIIENYKGTIFIGTRYNGLFIMKSNIIKASDKIKGGIINIISDLKKNLYIINDEKGVFQYNKDSITFLFPHKDFYHFYFLKNTRGDFWTGSYQDGIYFFKNNQWSKVFGGEQLNLYAFKEDSIAELWAATFVGLFRITNSPISAVSTFQEIKDEIIIRIFIDKDNNIWASSYGKGVYKLTRNEFENYEYPSTLPGPYPFIMLNDRKNTIWINSANYGLISYENNQFKYHKTFEKFHDRNIYCGIDLDSMILFAGDNIFLRYKNGGFNELFYNNPKSFIVTELIQHKDQIYSIVNSTTLWRLTKNGWEDTKYFSSNISLKYLFNDSKNNFWVGSDSGLFKIVDNKAIQFKKDQFTSKLNINTIAESKDSSLWIGTNDGLYVLKNNSIVKYFDNKNGLLSKNVFALKMTQDKVFIGTAFGLMIYSNGEFIPYTTNDGLINNYILPPKMEIQNNKLLVGAGNGLSIFRIKDSIKNRKSSTFLYEIITNIDTLVYNPLHISTHEKLYSHRKQMQLLFI